MFNAKIFTQTHIFLLKSNILFYYFLDNDWTLAHAISGEGSLLYSAIDSFKNTVLMSTYYCQAPCEVM